MPSFSAELPALVTDPRAYADAAEHLRAQLERLDWQAYVLAVYEVFAANPEPSAWHCEFIHDEMDRGQLVLERLELMHPAADTFSDGLEAVHAHHHHEHLFDQAFGLVSDLNDLDDWSLDSVEALCAEAVGPSTWAEIMTARAAEALAQAMETAAPNPPRKPRI